MQQLHTDQSVSFHNNMVDKDQRIAITKMVMKLLSEWRLTTTQQLNLLGLRETSRNMLIRYRNGQTAIPYDQDKLERVGMLLAIYKNLYDLYPENLEIRKTWILKQHKRFNNKTPLEVMLSGIFGIAGIMRFLDLQMVK